jgi:hypothetical protein
MLSSNVENMYVFCGLLIFKMFISLELAYIIMCGYFIGKIQYMCTVYFEQVHLSIVFPFPPCVPKCLVAFITLSSYENIYIFKILGVCKSFWQSFGHE